MAADGNGPHGRGAKFSHPERTVCGQQRAVVPFTGYETLWINTGTLCNIQCANCYIDSSPKNDRLVYIDHEEAAPYIMRAARLGAREIGFTGGEPFMNKDMLAMADTALEAGLDCLILSNGLQPMQRPQILGGLAQLQERFGGKLHLRISLDHHAPDHHDRERGDGTFALAVAGIDRLQAIGVRTSLAGRLSMIGDEAAGRAAYGTLIAAHGWRIDPADPEQLVLFPEMGEADPPEITAACWGILGKDPGSVMCASSRMLIKRKGASAPVLTACTLLVDDPQFEHGDCLQWAMGPTALNHAHCASFCVLGGASCS